MCLFLFNLVGYRLLISHWKQESDRSLVSKLDRGDYSQESLVEIKLAAPLNYPRDMPAFERTDGEIEVGGVFYRYVKMKWYNDTLSLLVVNNTEKVLAIELLNAAQAMPDGGTITISAEKVKFDESIEIFVTDTGQGIPADILPHVFEPFFTTKRGKGTGLGLSISQAYIRSHGGSIRVNSLPGQGTTVRFTLPIRQEGRPLIDNDEVVA